MKPRYLEQSDGPRAPMEVLILRAVQNDAARANDRRLRMAECDCMKPGPERTAKLARLKEEYRWAESNLRALATVCARKVGGSETAHFERLKAHITEAKRKGKPPWSDNEIPYRAGAKP